MQISLKKLQKVTRQSTKEEKNRFARKIYCGRVSEQRTKWQFGLSAIFPKAGDKGDRQNKIGSVIMPEIKWDADSVNL